MRRTTAMFIPAARVAAVTLTLAVIAAPFSGVVQAAITKPFTPKSEITLSPGIDYAVGVMKTTGGRRQSVRVATIDPGDSSVKLRALLSNDKVVKRELVSKLTKRKSKPGMKAMLSTNGDMSQRNAVDAYAAPQGLQVSNGELMVANACTRPTLGIDSAGVPRIGDVRVFIEVVIPGLRDPRTIHRVNTHRDDAKVVLFTRRFAASTRTADGGTEVILSLSDKLRPSGSQSVKVLKVRRGGNTDLRDGQAVISMKGPNNKWVKKLKVGQRLDLVTRFVRKADSRCGGKIAEATGWSDVVEALGGNHFTARNGQVAAPSKKVYPSGVQRHPRTGVGVTPEGKVLMVTVDGRQSGYSVGVTLAEMGKLMISLGARHAFNLDGGGSTDMARRFLASDEFKVTNRPSDGRERPATQALGAFEYTP